MSGENNSQNVEVSKSLPPAEASFADIRVAFKDAASVVLYKSFGLCFVLVLVNFAIMTFSLFLVPEIGSQPSLGKFALHSLITLTSFIFMSAILPIYILYFGSENKGVVTGVVETFSIFINKFFTLLAVSLLKGIIIIIGLICFIIPGIIFVWMFVFAEYAVIIENKSPIAALRRSAEVANGLKWYLVLFSIIYSIPLQMLEKIELKNYGHFEDNAFYVATGIQIQYGNGPIMKMLEDKINAIKLEKQKTSFMDERNDYNDLVHQANFIVAEQEPMQIDKPEKRSYQQQQPAQNKIDAYNKQIEVYQQMELYQKQMEEYIKQMEDYKKHAPQDAVYQQRIQEYEKQMEEYNAKMKEYNNRMNQPVPSNNVSSDAKLSERIAAPSKANLIPSFVLQTIIELYYITLFATLAVLYRRRIGQ